MYRDNINFLTLGKELYSPEPDAHGDATSTGPPKVSSRTNSFEIENLLKVLIKEDFT